MRNRQGSVAVIAVVSLVTLLGFTAVGVDLSLGWLAKKELQKALNAATKGGAHYLDGTDAGVTSAKNQAIALAAANKAAGKAIAISASDIETGIYNDTTGTFTASTVAASINSIRIKSSVSVNASFAKGGSFGTNKVTAGAQATGTMIAYGASEVECFIPVAIPKCVVEELYKAGGNTLEDVAFIFGSSSTNNSAWVSDDASTPSSSYLVKQIESLENNTCAGHTVSIGDTLGLNNGQVVPALNEVADAVNGSSVWWKESVWGTKPAKSGDWSTYSLIPDTNYGKIFEGPIVIVDVGSSYCTTGGPLSGTAPVSGFIKGAVYNVMKGPSAAKQSFVMRLNSLEDTDQGVATSSAAPDYGVVYYGSGNGF
jgi:hypothetical protein